MNDTNMINVDDYTRNLRLNTLANVNKNCVLANKKA